MWFSHASPEDISSLWRLQPRWCVSCCTAILLSWSWCFQETREKSKEKPLHNLCQSGPAWSCFSVGASLEIRKDIFIVKIIGLEGYYHHLMYRDQESNMKFTGSLPWQRTTLFFFNNPPGHLGKGQIYLLSEFLVQLQFAHTFSPTLFMVLICRELSCV